MSGVKGRSGRKSMRDEEKRFKVIELAWAEIFNSLTDPEIPKLKKIEIAEKIVLRDMPTTPLVDNSKHYHYVVYRNPKALRESARKVPELQTG